MPVNQKSILQRLDKLIELAQPKGNIQENVGEITSSTINILEILYGANSEKMKAYVQLYQPYARDQGKDYPKGYPVSESIRSDTLGVLKSIKSEIEAGLVGNLELQAQGGIFGDFITLAKESLDESKDVAAVLVSAALEDALKRFAVQNGLYVAEKDMLQVINALKGKGLLKGPQASIAQSYTKFRNKAFHAEWATIDKPSVSSAISFTEGFILENFS